MRKILAVFAVLMLSVGVAWAGWNIKQKPDGSTVWIDENGVEAHVAETYITIFMKDVSLPISVSVPVPITGVIETVYGVLQGPLQTADANLLVFAAPGTDANSEFEITDGSWPAMEIQNNTSAAGDLYTFTPTTTTTVTKGSVIYIESDGGGAHSSVLATPAMTFTIIINPK
jgi:hypothetical protein